MIQDDKKTKEHELALDNWAKSGYRGTALMTTGTGKTRLGIKAIEMSDNGSPFRALVVVPTENLRDNEWVKEFTKWGSSKYLFGDTVDRQCIKTAYKYVGRHYNIIVVDEVHMSLSGEYRALFENNTFDRIFCLTATVDDDEKRQFLESIAPVIYTCDVNRALELGLISNFIIYNLAVYMGGESSERYKSIQDNYSRLEGDLGGRRWAFGRAGALLRDRKERWERIRELNDLLKKMTDGSDKEVIYREGNEIRKHLESNADNYRLAQEFYKVMNVRKQFLYNLPEKVDVANQIVNMFPDRKTLVFAESIRFAQQLKVKIGSEAVIYHSQMGRKARQQSIDFYASELTDARVICSVRALNVGFNVPESSLGICASGNSKWLDQIQRNGRIVRYADGKRAIYVNLFAFDTQEMRWVSKRTEKISNNNVKWIFKLEDIK